MRKIKIVVFAISIMLTVLFCTGCATFDFSVEIKKDGNASMSYQVVLEEELYNILVKHETKKESTLSAESESSSELNETESTEPSNNTTSDENSERTRAIDLKDYVKEEVDGQVRYVYNTTNKDYSSYNELTEDLRKIEILPGIPLFDTITITSENSEIFTFHIKTMEVTAERLKNETSLQDIPVEWLTFNITVIMPGEIDDNQCSAGVTVTTLSENTIRFTMNDFTKSQSVSLRSLLVNSTPVPFIIIGAVSACITIILISTLADNKQSNGNKEKIE